MKKKIAFIRPKAWPLTNVKMAEVLRLQFPDYKIDLIDIEELVKAKTLVVVINILFVWLFYGWDIAVGHKKFKDAFWRTPYIFKKVSELLKQQLSDQNYNFTFQMQSIFDCSLDNVPHFIYTDHTHLANLNYVGFDSKKLYPKRWIDLENQVYTNATKIFVRSTNIQKSVVEQYHQPADKVICIYAGNNVEITHSTTEDKSYTGSNILFVGIDWERKGGPLLVQAFNKVLEKHPNARLTIVGANPSIQMKNCTAIGKVSPAELRSYYEAATIFCMPTNVEPFGIAFLEAMQARLPIIGTNVGAIPDFLQNEWNGFLVEPDDLQGVIDGITELLDDPNLCRLYGNRSAQLIKDKYSWKVVGQKIYTTVLENL